MRTFVKAYTADASMWCVDCANEAYGEESGAGETTRTVSVNAVDGEGNPVHPVFSWDIEGDEYCDSCGDAI